MLCNTQHTFTMSSTSDVSLTSIGSRRMRKRFLSIPKTRSIILRTDSHLPRHSIHNIHTVSNVLNAQQQQKSIVYRTKMEHTEGARETARENTRTCC